MTKHQLICRQMGQTFQEQMEEYESKGWQALPQTFSQWGDGFIILMFKVELNDPYRTEAPPSFPNYCQLAGKETVSG